MFYECWVSCLFLPWLGETVVSDDFLGRRGKLTFFFQKTQKFDQSCFEIKKKWTVYFSKAFEAAIIQLPKVENIAFTTWVHFPGSQNHVS